MRLAWLQLLSMLACGASLACASRPADPAAPEPTAAVPAPTEPTTAVPTAAEPIDAQPAPTAAVSTATAAHADDVAACAVDAECTFVSLGCCSTTPVNRTHAKAAASALAASGKPHCSVKAACGPGADGTWAGTPGRCIAGRCACDPSSPLVSNCRGQ